MADSLTPLLISRSLSRVATTVLYAHPHISEGKLDRFINNVQKPSPYLALDSKVSLVHHLTVRPTPIRPKHEQTPTYNEEQRLVDTSLPRLARLFPILKSFVLRDCLIHTQQDAITVFSSLPLMKPKKARLEIRMWPLTDDELGRDLALATKFSTRGFVRRETSPYSSFGLEGRWRDALYGDRDMDLPADWLDPDERSRALSDERARRQAYLQAIDIAAPHDFVDPQNPLGPRLRIPVARMDSLSRAIELCRDVFRTDFARTSVPYDMTIRRELVRMGPIRPQMTRQHASDVLQLLGHHLPADAPESDDSSIVERANSWADAARTRTIQEARRNRQSTGSSTAQAAGTGASTSAQVDSAKSAVSAAVDPPLDSQTPPDSHRKARDIAQRIADIRVLYSRSNDPYEPEGSLDDLDRIADSEDDDNDAEYALPQEAVRQSKLHLQAGSQQDEASSSTNQGVSSANTTNAGAVGSQLVSTAPGDRIAEALPWSAIRDVDQALATTPQTRDTAIHADSPLIDTSSRQLQPLSDGVNTSRGRSRHRPIPRLTLDMAENDDESDHMSSTVSDIAADGGWTNWHERQASMMNAQLWYDGPAPAPSTITGVPQASTAEYCANNAIGPDNASTGGGLLIHELVVPGPRRHPARLASAIRKQMLHLIENTWSPTLQAFSLVTLDPLASLIAQSPLLDLWVNVPVPHIRVQLPRSINPLVIFKGTAENARDRARLLGFPVLPVRGLVAPHPGANTHATSLRDQYPQTQVVDPTVGGDGSGGGLVHPNTRLFEVEVNTIREMMDDMWNQAGAELPPQVCRILTGTQDWSEVGLCE